MKARMDYVKVPGVRDAANVRDPHLPASGEAA